MPDDGRAGDRRLFFGVPLTTEVRQGIDNHLRRALERRGLPGRVVPAANWHVTVRFLGPSDEAAYARIAEATAAADLGQAFEVRFGALGAFPRPDRARVVWLGVRAGVEPLRSLAREVERAAVAAGYPAETRPFAAHLTLSRLKPDRDVRDLLVAVPPYEATMPVREVVLFQSFLGPAGARYEALRRYRLA